MTKILLLEAFNKRDFNKVSRLVERLLSKRLGLQLYRYGGDNGFYQTTREQLGKLMGILYFTQKQNLTFRINHDMKLSQSFRITSCDIWLDDWYPGKRPTKTLIIPEHFNIVQTINAITNFLADPKIKNVIALSEASIDPEDPSNTLLMEGGKVSPKILAQRYINLWTSAKKAIEEKKDFITKAWYDEKEDAIYITRPELNAIKDFYKVKIPTSVWDMKSGQRGIFKLPAPEKTTAVASQGKKEQPPILDSKIENLIKGIYDEIEYKKANYVVNLFKDLIQSVARGMPRHAVVYGKAGVGKTFNALKALEEIGLKEGEDFFFSRTQLTPFGLYEFLFKHRNHMVILDDADKIFHDVNSVNILKGALDTTSSKVSYYEKNRTYNVEGMDEAERAAREKEAEDLLLDPDRDETVQIPSEFYFNGSLVVITNMDISELDKHGALASRVESLDMTLTKSETMSYIIGILDKIQPPSGAKLSYEEKKKVWEVYSEAVLKLNPDADPSIRKFAICLDIYASGSKFWKARVISAAANVRYYDI